MWPFQGDGLRSKRGRLNVIGVFQHALAPQARFCRPSGALDVMLAQPSTGWRPRLLPDAAPRLKESEASQYALLQAYVGVEDLEENEAG